MSLANMEIIMQGLKDNKETFIKQFINQTFTKQHEVKDIKAEFQSEISPDFISKINEYISEIKNNEEFIKTLNDFTKEASKYSHFTDKVNNYNELNEAEKKKPEETRDYAKLHKASNNLTLAVTDRSIDEQKKFIVELKNNNKESEKKQNKYAKEFSKLEKALDIAFRIKDSQELDSLLNSIGKDLGIDIEQIKNFQKIQDNNNNIEVEEEVILRPKDIKSLQQRYEEAKTESEEVKTSTAKNDTKPLGQLLHELILGSDKDYIKNGKHILSVEEIANYKALELNAEAAKAAYKTQYKDQSKILNIIEQYYTVKEHIKKFESFSPNDILSWANDIKGNLTNDEGDICKTIAIMDRAYNLAFEGKNLRDTQIVSTLVFLNNEEDYGRLCEIKTGEGKTTIVALLATIKALQGETVDIITSNSVLASEGEEKNEDFYSLFGLTVATNNSDKENNPALGANGAYTADILYGNISNFQFDYLRDSFEGLGTRAERDFGTVIIDEVDSMLIDNGAHIAKLSGPMPGMENLRYIYVEIWKTLQEVLVDIEKSDNKKIEQLKTNALDNKIDKGEFLKSLNDIIDTKNDRVKEDIKSKLGDFAFAEEKQIIPSHVQSYIDAKLEKWIDLAIHAAYECEEDKQYKIETNAEGEKVIVPVDYANTGVTMKNTIWSEGLHQFVQLKHQLHLTPESLTSSFISNLGYINKYGNKIYGLTGTLGSIAEQELLKQIYNLDYAKISTFKDKKFQELEGQTVSDDEWSTLVAIDALLHTDHGRAVLVVCQTISDLKKLQKTLELLKAKGLANGINIITYEDESKSDVTKDPLDSGTIVLSTNIAGRGTDFDTTKQVEDAGGLHVCVGFLPCNKRVEDQAFGRTARQGKNGTAKLIIKQSEVDKLTGGKEIDYQNIELIKNIRDECESTRIKDIEDNKVRELNFQDAIFEKFSESYRSTKDNLEEGSARYVLKDLKDFWAFWLERQHFSANNLPNKTADIIDKVDNEIEEFKKEAKEIIEEGKIQFNPYYSIKQSEYFLRRDKQDEAQKALEKALEIGKNTPDALYAANLKLFEIWLQKGDVMANHFKKALAECFFMSVKISDDYKVKAKSNLEKALKGLRKEIDYIEKKFFTQKEPANQKNVVADNELDESLSTQENKSTEEIVNSEAPGNINIAEQPSIEEQKESEEKDKAPFYIHLESKYYALLTYANSIEGLIKQIDESEDNGLIISSRIPDYLANLKSEESDSADNQIKDHINPTEVHELSTNGLDTSYGVNKSYPASTEIITGVKIQILGGMGLFPLTIFCPALFHVATTMISEGVCDLMIELIQERETGFDGTEYAKGKLISYGTSFATMGISKAASAIKLFKTASKTSAGISKNLSKNKTMIDSFKKVASQIEKTKAFNAIKKNASDMMDHLSDLNKVPPGKLAKSKELAKSIVLDVTNSIVMEKVVTASLSQILNSLKPKIKEEVKNSVNGNIDAANLASKNQKEIFKKIDKIIAGDFSQIASEVGGEIASGVARQAGGAKLKALSLTVDGLVTFSKVMGYTEGFCKKLQSALNKENSDSSDNNQSAGQMLEEISDKVAEKIYGMIQHFTGKVANTAIVMPAISGIMKSFDHQTKNKHDYKVKQDKTKKNNTEGSDSISNKGNTDIDISQAHTIIDTPKIIKSINNLDTLHNVADYKGISNIYVRMWHKAIAQ